MRKKYSAFAFLVTIILALIASESWAQSTLPDLEDPLGRRWFKEKESEGRSSLTLSSMRALAVEDEEETLSKFSKSSNDFESIFKDVVADARQTLVIVRSKGLSKSQKARKRQIALGTVVSEDGFVLTKASELKGGFILRVC